MSAFRSMRFAGRAVGRYFRRRGLRWAIFGVRIGCIAWGAIMLGSLLEVAPSGWAMVGVITLYAVHRIGGALDRLHPVVITNFRGDTLEIQGGSFTLVRDDLDRAVERLVAAERGKAATGAERHPPEDRVVDAAASGDRPNGGKNTP